GVDESSIHLLKNLYQNCYTRIRLNEVTSNMVRLSSGVKQGDPLSPVLFNIVIDQLLENLNHSYLGVVLGDVRLPVLAYADDLALTASSDDDLQSLIDITTASLNKVGLSLNRSKSVVMGCQSPITVDGTALANVTSIKYLGVVINSDGKT